jgi:DNA-binding NtrC family response regulator
MADPALILVADDEEWVRLALGRLLEGAGYRVETASGGAETKERIRRATYDMVIVDLRLKDVDGIDVLKAAAAVAGGPEVLLITAHGTLESAVEAIKLGAFDYLAKPLDSKRVLLTVEQALERRRLRSELSLLRRQVGEKYGRANIIAGSAAMRRVLDLVELVSSTDSTVLIEGESGTGKELVARAIHFDGARAAGPFVTVNCGALPEPLLESELFGHVKGAFTGAVRDKKGLFEEAGGGTLLLDEIGDLPLPIQVKLLRILQDGELRRVGDVASHRVSTRVIASTNKRLQELVARSAFREDLFYRLNVIPIVLPPLRERKEDILPLASHFVAEFSRKLGRDVHGFSAPALAILLEHDWPGNVRELQNVVERTITLSSSMLLSLDDVQASLSLGGIARSATAPAPEGDAGSLRSTYRMLERDTIARALGRHGWDRSAAAAELGISRTSLWRRMKEYSLVSPPPDLQSPVSRAKQELPKGTA